MQSGKVNAGCLLLVTCCLFDGGRKKLSWLSLFSGYHGWDLRLGDYSLRSEWLFGVWCSVFVGWKKLSLVVVVVWLSLLGCLGIITNYE